jgi:hypothetical protein
MALHIVTKNFFLSCESITSVVIEKETLTNKTKSSKTKKKVPDIFYIRITYYPMANKNSSIRDREDDVTITIEGEKETQALYTEIVKTIQEHYPNEAYLDKLMNKLIST